MNAKQAVFIFAAAVLVAGIAGRGVARLDAKQPLPAEAGDLGAATALQVKDPAGQVVLEGAFGAAAQDGGEQERKATLTGAGSARGEAEIETSRASSGETRQELEVVVKGLAASSTFTVLVDGRQLATLSTDNQGNGEIELAGVRR